MNGPTFTEIREDGTTWTSVQYVLCRVEGCVRSTHEGMAMEDESCGLLKLKIKDDNNPYCGAVLTVDRWIADGWKI